MSIQELCLIPKKIVENLNLSQTNNNKDSVYILNKKTSFLPYSDPSEYKSDLKEQLKILKVKNLLLERHYFIQCKLLSTYQLMNMTE